MLEDILETASAVHVVLSNGQRIRLYEREEGRLEVSMSEGRMVLLPKVSNVIEVAEAGDL